MNWAGQGWFKLICEQSHTCYLGERGARHEWGYRLRGMPGLRAAREGLARICGGQGGSVIEPVVLRLKIFGPQFDRRAMRGAVGGMVPGVAITVQGL